MVDSSLALPLYHQVAGILRQRINNGENSVGEKLASEDELAAEFSVSRATIRQAVGELVVEGLLVRKQGSGTFVQPRNPKVLQQRFRGSLGDLINESHLAKTRNVTITHDERLPEKIASALQLDAPLGTAVRRTRMMNAEPFAYTVTYLPPDLGVLLTPQRLRKSALMEILIDEGIHLTSATQSIRSQLADAEVCDRIDVGIGAAVLYVERLVSDRAGRPVEFVQTWYRGDRYEFSVNLDLSEAGEALYKNLA
ncbi:MAG: GntR family transcriptional regulator [Microbacterium sp.]|uniref:GntR family transcriptional regulator n=1 Tax=Microbacterium sp. TaxID=51671 RepID=UPI00260D5CE0|nr:GntR family transcriptional regulator [Microbacterium sp.]MCX6502935.1 GntR family transcriptional regulator [Microbacterium sp.]